MVLCVIVYSKSSFKKFKVENLWTVPPAVISKLPVLGGSHNVKFMVIVEGFGLPAGANRNERVSEGMDIIPS